MELTTRLLADAATQTPDGKVHILGGQWDTIAALAFPATQPSMAVVLVISFDEDEGSRPHTVSVALFKDGGAVGTEASGLLKPLLPPGEPGRAQTLPVVLTIPFVRFEFAGDYEWVIDVDGQRLGSLPLRVNLLQVPPPTERVVLGSGRGG